MLSKLKVYAPATIANVGVGFDNLGLAIQPIDGSLLGDIITVEESSNFSFSMLGKFASFLPSDETNIVFSAYKLFSCELNKIKKIVKPLKVSLEKNMPIGSGLGSSSCSASASLVAYNKIHNEPFNSQELLLMMGQMEANISGGVAHYDNVAPSFLGGMQLISNVNITENLPIFDNWYWIVAYPGISISTLDARNILPNSYSRNDIVKQVRNLSNFIHSLHTNNEILALASLDDIIAEPYRECLLPNYKLVKKEINNSGAIALGISGSGPTVFAISDNLEKAFEIKNKFQQYYIQNEFGFVHICKVDNNGTVIVSKE